MNSDGFANEFLHAYLVDAERGKARSAEEYAAMFPGHEHEVAAQLALLRNEQPDDELPEIPGVEVERMIGHGGQGVVYRGRQSYLDRDVAVKLLRDVPFSDGWVTRFEREAKTLAGLTHGNIVACHQGGTNPAGQCYLVMEYVDGPNLRKWVADHGPLDVPTALRLVRALAGALGHAHAAGIIHRDVKPENVLLQPDESDGMPFTPKLADLGLARRQRMPSDVSLMTPIGMVLGTPATMAPEQLDDPEGVDHRADIYGLGCVLFHALTGKRAFPAGDLATVIRAKVAGRPPDVRDALPEIPKRVARLTASMMAPRREDRPQSHEEVVARCTALLERRTGRRRVVAFVAVAAVVGIAWWIRSLTSTAPPLIVLAQSSEVVEGDRVELRARANDPAGGRLRYSWTQVVGPKVALANPTAESASFRAPIGFDSASLGFRIRVTSGERSATDIAKVEVRGDPRFAALAPGKTIELFDPDYHARIAGWQKQGGQWGPTEAAHPGAAGTCRDGRGRLTRRLPRGKWTLRGAIEPIRLFDSKTGHEKEIAAIGLHVGLDCGNGFVLELRPSRTEGQYVAHARHVIADDWEAVDMLGDGKTGAWAQGRPFRFSIAWNGKTIVAACDKDELAAVDPSKWGTTYPPSRLTLFVDSGGGCFCTLSLTGR